MDINKYLERIHYKGELKPTLRVLSDLQQSHLLAVPFENLDIYYKKPIRLKTEKIYQKLIAAKRGGFCYELNGLFFELLTEIGFKAIRISARTYNSNSNDFGDEFDHLAIVVFLDNTAYLVDVGFGEFAFHPLKLEPDKIQKDQRGDFIVESYKDKSYAVFKLNNSGKVPQYIFSTTARDFNDFQEMCIYHQTNAHSHFTQKRLISKPTLHGRITLAGNKLKITENEEVITEKELNNDIEYLICLSEYFNINMQEIKLGR